VGLFAPFSVRERRGNSIRVLLQADGLRKTGRTDFCLYSYEPTGGEPGYPEEQVGRYVWPKIFPVGQRMAPLPCRLVHVHHCIGAMLLNQPYVLDMPSCMTLQTQSVYRHEGRLLKRLLVRYLVSPLMLARAERRAVLNAKRVIVASDSIRRDVQTHIAALPDDRFVTLTNPVDVSAYHRVPVDGLVVGVSASDFRDNLDRGCLEVTREVAQRLSGVPFVIAGRLSEAQRAGIETLPNVRLLGSIGPDRYRQFLGEISVFLNPYLAFWDFGGSKFKLLEAAAAGLPVISSRAGAIGFPDTDALLLADDVDAIVAQIERLNTSSLRREAGGRVRAIVEAKHGHIQEADKLKALYDEVLSES
jgi:glycosyltransferase involved in cell wall biosynthesis